MLNACDKSIADVGGGVDENGVVLGGSNSEVLLGIVGGGVEGATVGVPGVD